jgi:hypothetical protein
VNIVERGTQGANRHGVAGFGVADIFVIGACAG